MKVQIEEKEKQEFKPVKLEILFESKNELINLWYRLNLSNCQVDKFCKDTDIPDEFENSLKEGNKSNLLLWEKVSLILKDLEK
jgi:hypothetical protein